MRNRILKELGYILDENTVGFFSFTVSRTKDRIIPTVTWICDKGLPEQRNEISDALFNLFDKVKPVFKSEKSKINL
jgi:hypothetical protein